MENSASLWRASANEAVAYSEDFPEPFLVLPELTDGSIGQGNATKIIIEVDICNPDRCMLKVTDNGSGIKNTHRLTKWASKKTSDVYHRYGHGSKKCLTKFAPIYEHAVWKVEWRRNGCLYRIESPFTDELEPTEVENNQTTLMPSGTEWYIEFNLQVLGKFNTKDSIFKALKEIMLTRYHQSIFHKCIFEIIVKDKEGNPYYENSKNHKWLTLEESLKNDKDIQIVKECEIEGLFKNSKYTFNLYHIVTNCKGNKRWKTKDEFPFYGRKCMEASRIHIGMNDRYIEAYPYAKFIGKQAHNDTNGYFGFLNMYADSIEVLQHLPQPCTTKVKFQEDQIFTEFLDSVRDAINEYMIEKEKRLRQIRMEKKERELQEKRQKRLEEEKAAQVKAEQGKETQEKMIRRILIKKEKLIDESRDQVELEGISEDAEYRELFREFSNRLNQKNKAQSIEILKQILALESLNK